MKGAPPQIRPDSSITIGSTPSQHPSHDIVGRCQTSCPSRRLLGQTTPHHGDLGCNKSKSGGLDRCRYDGLMYSERRSQCEMKVPPPPYSSRTVHHCKIDTQPASFTWHDGTLPTLLPGQGSSGLKSAPPRRPRLQRIEEPRFGPVRRTSKPTRWLFQGTLV